MNIYFLLMKIYQKLVLNDFEIEWQKTYLRML